MRRLSRDNKKAAGVKPLVSIIIIIIIVKLQKKEGKKRKCI